MKQRESGLGIFEKRCSLTSFLPGNFRPDAAGDQPKAATGCLQLDLPGTEVRITYTCRIDDMPTAWEGLVPASGFFLSRPYLQLLEKTPPKGVETGYLLFRRQHRPIGIAMLQLVDFDGAAALLHLETAGPGSAGWLEKAKRQLAAALRFRVMVCGNLLLTGAHGYHFSSDIDPVEATRLLKTGMDKLSAYLNKTGTPVHASLIKDVAADASAAVAAGLGHSFHRLVFQPSMVFTIPPAWGAFDDYLESLNSKYRVRLRRARKKAAGIQRRTLSGPEIHHHRQRLRDLYREVVNASDFNLVELADDYFGQFKEQLPSDFCLYGYFLDDQLVGFATTIVNGCELEAHFLGFDSEINRSRQLYLNMLYDIIGEGIDRKKERIIFARTALEIKSSVGAQPEHYHNYFQHHRRWFNRLVPHLIRLLEPACEWTPRNPFR